MKGIKGKIRNLISWSRNQLDSEQKLYWLAVISTVCCTVLSCIMLFIPNVLGVADDGSVTKVIHGAGLDYETGVSANPDYFVREYVWKANTQNYSWSLQTFIILLAKKLDFWFTGDRIFDIRFLGFLYLILYIPAIFFIVKAALERLKYFSEMFIASLAAVFIFADISYITYFNSFYPEALIFICFLYLFGSVMQLQKQRGMNVFYILVFAVAGSACCFIRQYCFLTGILCAVFCLFQFFRDQKKSTKVMYLIAGALLISAAMTSFFTMENDYSKVDKIHAMTGGVLFQSENPEKTLQEMGIDVSYSLLADTSCYQNFPVLTGEEDFLQEEFLNQYHGIEIAQYYLKHPLDMVSMFDIAIKTNMDITKTNCSNYEISASMPEGAKSIFWSGYSIYKKRSAPKTVGYFVILIIAFTVISGRSFSLRKTEDLNKRIYFEAMMLLTAMMVVQTMYHIIHSGQLALAQYNAQLGIGMDIMLYYLIIEILTRVNIFDKGGKK